MAHFCALGRIIGQTEVVLISKDQKDRTVCVILCVLLIETRAFNEVAITPAAVRVKIIYPAAG